MREYVRRCVCWLLGHHPVGPPFYSPMCARCGLILHDNCTAWGDDSDWDAFVDARTACPVDGSKRVPLRHNPHPGFGSVSLEQDGEVVWSTYRPEDSRTFITFENRAKADPDHDWRVRVDGPMYGVVYQRHAAKTWVAVQRLDGFA